MGAAAALAVLRTLVGERDGFLREELGNLGVGRMLTWPPVSLLAVSFAVRLIFVGGSLSLGLFQGNSTLVLVACQDARGLLFQWVFWGFQWQGSWD